MTTHVQRKQPVDLSVLVAGAGVGGLMTALECWRQGFNVRVLEKAPENVTSGDSFSIGPSGVSAFKHWPEMEKRRAQVAYDPVLTVCSITGERLKGPMGMSAFLSKDVPKEKAYVYRYERPAFHALLLEQAAKIGLQVEYGKDVAEYVDDEAASQAGVVLKDGTRIKADVVVAADGRRSRSWALVGGHPAPARSSGRALFRCAFPVEIALADPVIAERFKLHDGRPVVEMWQGENFSATFARTETSMGFGVDHPDTGTAEESWSSRVPVSELLELSATVPGWPDFANRVWNMAPEGKVVDWKLMWRDPQEKWTSPRGRVVQLGDAAHAFLPSSGNGGTQALEDGISLAQCLAIAGKERVADATRVHNLLRFERVSYLQAFGVANAFVRQRKDDKKVMHATLGKWILEHDPAEYAEENFEAARLHLVEGTEFKSTNTPPGAVYRPWTFESLSEALKNGESTILDGDWH